MNKEYLISADLITVSCEKTNILDLIFILLSKLDHVWFYALYIDVPPPFFFKNKGNYSYYILWFMVIFVLKIIGMLKLLWFHHCDVSVYQSPRKKLDIT